MSTCRKINIVSILIILGVFMTVWAAPLLADGIGINNVKAQQSYADQTAPQPSGQTAGLVESLKGFFDGWTVNINQSNPRIVTVSGKSMPVPGLSDISKKALESAPEAIRNHLSAVIDFDLYGLEVAHVKSFGRFASIVFQQAYSGVKVDLSGLRVMINDRGALVFLKSDLVPDIEISTVPSVTPDQATRIAFGDPGLIPDESDISCNELVIHVDDAGKSRLAYKLIGVTFDPMARWLVYVDALSGTIIEKTNTTLYEEIDGDIDGHIYYTYKGYNEYDEFVDIDGPMEEAAYWIYYEEGDIPKAGEDGVKANTSVFYADENGYYHYTGTVGANNFRFNFSLGSRLCEIYIESEPGEGDWDAAFIPSETFNIDNGVEFTLDFDWTDYTSDIRYHEGQHVAHYVRGMGVYFEDLIGDGIVGADVRRETYIRDFSFVGTDYLGIATEYTIALTPFFGQGKEEYSCKVVSHEMAHSVMFLNYDGNMPTYWSEGQAYYFSHSYLNRDNPPSKVLYDPKTHFVNNEPHYKGMVLTGAWWDVRDILGQGYTDTLVFWSSHFDISTFGTSMQSVLLVDDNDGNLSNGTPNLSTIETKFADHYVGPNLPFIYYLNDEVMYTNPTLDVIVTESNEYTIYQTYPWDYIVWDFGDGTTPVIYFEPNHAYNECGTYNLNCKAYYPWGMREENIDVNVTAGDIILVSDNEGCSGAHFRIDIALENPLATDYISLPIKYDGDVDLVFDSVSQVGTRSEGMTVTLFTDIPNYYFKQYLIEGNGTVEELAAGDGVILKLYFTAQGADYLEDETQIRVEEFGGIYPEIVHGSISDEPVTNPGSYTVTYFPGDANGDGGVNVGDAVYIINYLDVEDPGPAPDPIESADANCDGEVTIADASFIVAFVFSGGPAPECCDDNDPLKMVGDGTPMGLPGKFSLSQNYPNPFNPGTIIGYDLPVADHVRLEVINILGQRVVTLVDKVQAAGHFEVMWDGKDKNGRTVASGIYFYRLQAGDFAASRKMILQK